ncbi:acetyl-CoA acetyltransferase [Sphingobium jiangsuense]|uniref:Acetyl-CoA C-acetyltransferase n=1 Tax=Sphingobium jiangsuense TaxID=870476 RepID=A0A7W6BF77_9SPHN|nr:acetyl-CoA C-acetyltransferase [Sphingobium jiangsuense]MBB3925788.1 acetyl-CoA C-acetyltransferase [Sphingobium jiangsuense]GLT00954.1 acetyl-CoA acetyltransferase [Sphingobium jiangsuense]
MAEAYIVEAVRTAGGRRNGRLSGIHPDDLGAFSLNAIVDRTGIDPAAVEDVIFGCVSQVGEQSMHVGRNVVLASKLPQSVPAVTIDRQCGSSQQAIHFAAQAVMSGTMDMVIAGGVESMSRVPMGTPTLPGTGAMPWAQSVLDRYNVPTFSQFTGAEMIARKWGFTREMLDAYGLESHRRAIAATQAGAFDREIVPVPITLPDGAADTHVRDEGIRFDASMDSMAGVKLLVEGGSITAATASQITDGSSAVLVVSERALKDHGLTPLARIVNLTVTAGDPVIMLEEPLYATDKALKKAGLRIEDIDLYEVNEAFAPVPMAWAKHVGADPAKLNAHGGAIALGHPLGATGAKLMATLVHGLRARGGKYGLQTMCEGGGIANVTIVEAL